MNCDSFLNKNNVSRETKEQLATYVSLLCKWNKSINLIGKSTEDEIWQRHILDSAQLINHINQGDTIADLGSGAGIPGIILSILGAPVVHLIESDKKKAAFLFEASRISSNVIYIHNDRIENCRELKVDVVTARALAPLDKLLHLARPFCLPHSKCLFLKGRGLIQELGEDRNLDYELFPSISSDDSWVIQVNKVVYENQDNSHS